MSEPRFPLRFVILASGQGTNARALMERARANPGLLQCVGLVSDRETAAAIQIAKALGVETAVFPADKEEGLLAFLRAKQPAWACLAGYKRLVGKAFLDFFQDASLGSARVMNVHPSLLPAYPGLRGYDRAYADGVKVSGVTVHLVDSGLDTGRVILQRPFVREDSDDLASFAAKGRKIELEIFPASLELAAKGRLRLREREGSRWISAESAE